MLRLTILNIPGWLCSLPHSPQRAGVTCSALCHVGDTCLASDTCQGPLVTTAWRRQCPLCVTDTQNAHSLPRPSHSEVTNWSIWDSNHLSRCFRDCRLHESGAPNAQGDICLCGQVCVSQQICGQSHNNNNYYHDNNYNNNSLCDQLSALSASHPAPDVSVAKICDIKSDSSCEGQGVKESWWCEKFLLITALTSGEWSQVQGWHSPWWWLREKGRWRKEPSHAWD